MPVGTSPMPVAAMNAVIVSDRLMRVEASCSAAGPAAIRTIIVSPTAREIASTNEATIPEIAAGTMTRVETWTWSRRGRRRPRGARRDGLIASSESDATVGISMTPMTMPAESALKMLDVDADRRAAAAS